jgi:hypothetical protein
MRIRFSIRDLLWLTVIVALALCWWINSGEQIRKLSTLKQQVTDLENRLARSEADGREYAAQKERLQERHESDQAMLDALAKIPAPPYVYRPRDRSNETLRMTREEFVKLAPFRAIVLSKDELPFDRTKTYSGADKLWKVILRDEEDGKLISLDPILTDVNGAGSISSLEVGKSYEFPAGIWKNHNKREF